MQTKKIATTLAALLLAAALWSPVRAASPVQTEFYGVTFGKSYFGVKTWMARKYENIASTRDELLYRNMTFAGHNWEYVRMDFDAKKKFYHIGFEKPCSTEESAMSRYGLIRDLLQEKYGKGTTLEETDRISTFFNDNDGHYVYIVAERSESRGGELLWYCHLDYYDKELLGKETQRLRNDL